MSISDWIKKYVLLILIGAIVVIFFSSCSMRKDTNTVDLNLTFDMTQLTNSGQPFYVIVSSEGDSKYIDSTYETVKQNFTDSGYSKFFLIPQNGSESKDFYIKTGDSVSVYVLFSNPNTQRWKYRISNLVDDCSFTFKLSQNSISNVSAD